MKHLKTEILIDAPKEQVWNILIDLAGYANWNPFIVSSEGEAIVGQKLKNKLMNNGKATVFSPVVTKVVPFREFEWLGSGMLGMFKGRHYFILEDLGENQTKFIHGEHFSGLLSGLILQLIGDSTKQGFESMNSALKNQVEQLAKS